MPVVLAKSLLDNIHHLTETTTATGIIGSSFARGAKGCSGILQQSAEQGCSETSPSPMVLQGFCDISAHGYYARIGFQHGNPYKFMSLKSFSLYF